MTATSSARSKLAAIAAGSAITLATAGLVVGASGTDAEAASALTITPNPRMEGAEFQGWGTSLVWFAHATGGYPDHLRDELYDAVFGSEGLDLNIARYNIGGQNATDIADYLRPGGAVDGWWAEDPDGSAGVYGGAATDYASRAAVRAAFDPMNPAHIDTDADAAQRWWVEELAQNDQITHWEAFANSAPYFMTESGYVSGGFSSTAEQLRPDSIESFSRYLAVVVDELEAAHGIDFHSIDPLNEPNTNYWGTQLSGGVPVGGRQEGMHVGPARQAQLVTALRAVLNDPAVATDAVVSAMDETNPGTFVTNWEAYGPQARAAVDQMNVHTYGTGQRLQVRDLSKQADKPLWMSEIEGSWVSGWNPLPIENGLGLAGRIHDDLRELEPEAWVLWQPIEDRYNMEPTGENLNWGSIFVDFDCTWFDEGGTQTFKSERRVAAAGGDPSGVDECGIVYNSKFNTMRNFTHFITPGSHLIPTDNTATTAAITATRDGLTLVHSNATEQARTVTVDLSGFASIAEGATITPYVTTQAPTLDAPFANALVEGDTVQVNRAAKTATVTVPAKSVSSLVITGVSGISDDAPGLVDGHTYQLQGAQSSLMLDSSTNRLRIQQPASTPQAGAAQAWTVHHVEPGARSDIQRVVLTDGQGRVMGATGADTDLRQISVDQAKADPQTRWIVNSSDGTRFSLVNEALSRTLEVGGQSTSAGATVGWWTSSGGPHQLWIPRDLDPRPTTVALRTTAGVVPDLPGSVAPRYSWGAGAPVAVEWDMPMPSAWDALGTVTVQGSATDIYGSEVEVEARVDVGGLTATNPRSLTTYAGASVATVAALAPSTVDAHVGASTQSFAVPVTWDFSGLSASDFAAPGMVTVPGTAVDEGEQLDAVLYVHVTAAVERNINPEPTTQASATSTEPGYPVDRTRNGVRTDKGWSNWVSSNKPTQDTLTYVYDGLQTLTGAGVYFYPDGNTTSWAQTLQLQYRDADGQWQSVPGYASAVSPGGPVPPNGPVVVEEFDEPIVADAFRVVMNAFANTHMVVSEVEVTALTAGVADESRLADLRLDGQTVEGFDPDQAAYSAHVEGSRYPTVTAYAFDEGAEVSVDQAAVLNGGVATITVRAADGSGTTIYTVSIDRSVRIVSAEIVGDAVAGATVDADVVVDPADAVVTAQWRLDGDTVGSAHEPLQLTTDMIGQALVLAVSAEAEGYTGPVTATSDPVTVGAPLGWADATLSSLTLDGEAVDGFSPSATTYAVTVTGSSLPVIAAQAASGYATVDVTQPTASDPVGRVLVTAGDGTAQEYVVTIARQVGLSLEVQGAVRAGATLVADVQTDPADADVAFAWTIDGEPAGDTEVLDIPITATGAVVALTVTAAAEGFVSATAAMEAQTVQAPAGISPRIELEATSVVAGASLGVTGSGLTPGGQVVVELRSEPVELAVVDADAQGAVGVTVVIPEDTAPGSHRIVVTDVTTGLVAQASVEVVAAEDPSSGGEVPGAGGDGLSQTGASVLVAASIALMMLIAGAALLRRRAAAG